MNTNESKVYYYSRMHYVQWINKSKNYIDPNYGRHFEVQQQSVATELMCLVPVDGSKIVWIHSFVNTRDGMRKVMIQRIALFLYVTSTYEVCECGKWWDGRHICVLVEWTLGLGPKKYLVSKDNTFHRVCCHHRCRRRRRRAINNKDNESSNTLHLCRAEADI